MVGDVFDRLAELRRRRTRVALVLCSPPFLALRSYLPDGHPLKRMEIGSEATPAAFVDVMLALVAECAHVLAPWGSVALELGDTYAGSGGAGGDYPEGGMRAGQPTFPGSAKVRRTAGDYPIRDDNPRPSRSGRTRVDGNGMVFRGGQRQDDKQGTGWPRDKSLAGIPEAVMLSLAYGYNVLDRRGPDSPAGRWMIRNFKPWVRSNPPVGALGDKERPATSYVIVATRDPQRYFDLDAVRTYSDYHRESLYTNRATPPGQKPNGSQHTTNAAGAPPRDWCHSVDMVLDAELDRMAGKRAGNPRAAAGTSRPNTQPNGQRGGNWDTLDVADTPSTVGARGVHLRRALERAGILTTLDAVDQSPKGYRGAHYAVWPPELVRLLVDEMCPRRVCTVCGQPSRRIVSEPTYVNDNGTERADLDETWRHGRVGLKGDQLGKAGHLTRRAETLGWSDCGCPGADRWQPGVVLDPFVGSGTTLAVCSGMGRESIGIDLDYTNVELAMGRVGVFLDVEWPEPDLVLLAGRALGPGSPHPAHYDRWAHQLDSVRAELVGWLLGWVVAALAAAVGAPLEGDDMPVSIPPPRARNGRKVSAMVGQRSMFDHQA